MEFLIEILAIFWGVGGGSAFETKNGRRVQAALFH